MKKGKERRQYPRYRAGRLSLKVFPQSSEQLISHPDKVTVLDYHASGLGLVSDHEYSANERLEMELVIDGIQIDGIIGEVCYCIPGERTGIRFVFEDNEYMTSDSVLSTLEAIEKKLYVSYARSVVSSASRPSFRRDRYGRGSQ